MPWQKGKSRKRYNTGKRAYGTRLKRQGIRKIGSGTLGLIPQVSQITSILTLGSGVTDITRSRRYSNYGKGRKR